MKKASFLVILYICLASATFAQSKAEWNPLVFLDNQLYPSFLLATATMKEDFGSSPYYTSKAGPYYIGSTNSPIGIIITSPKKKTEVKVSVKVDGYVDPQTYTAILPENEKTYLVMPPMIWNWEKLRNTRQPTPVNITFNVTINGKAQDVKNVVGTVRSVNEALLGYHKPITNEWIDTTWVITAYVNEDHPWIDQLLKEALDTGLVDAFDGYQSKDAKQVLDQIAAIWNVMQRRGFRYSSITENSNASRTVFTQTVRLFDDSILASQANCVDGTVLLAAILQKIGIEAYIVTVPGHCFLAFKLDPNERAIALETTMMGSANLRGLTAEAARKASINSFLAAIDSATKLMGKEDPNFAALKPRYSMMKVTHARQFNILPITR